MRSKFIKAISLAAVMALAAGCSNKAEPVKAEPPSSNNNVNLTEKEVKPIEAEELKEQVKPLPLDSLAEKYKAKTPKQWGERVDGIKTSLNTTDKVIALTFDACGGAGSNGYDEELINYLIEQQIPATLFINYRWIDANKDTFMKLSSNPLFEIENHGYQHKPLSMNGKYVYGIKGTKDAAEIMEEVLLNTEKIEKLTGRKPRFFRPGTAYGDEVAVSLVRELGQEVVGYNVLGDAGATYNKNQIRESCLKAKPGSIILLHMNHPEKQTFEGIKLVIPELKQKGFKFVKLSAYELK